MTQTQKDEATMYYSIFQDVSNQIVELNLIWTEAQREFAGTLQHLVPIQNNFDNATDWILKTETLFSEQLKDFKHMFDLILEGEKHVDQAKNNLVSSSVCFAEVIK